MSFATLKHYLDSQTPSIIWYTYPNSEYCQHFLMFEDYFIIWIIKKIKTQGGM